MTASHDASPAPVTDDDADAVTDDGYDGYRPGCTCILGNDASITTTSILDCRTHGTLHR